MHRKISTLNRDINAEKLEYRAREEKEEDLHLMSDTLIAIIYMNKAIIE